MKQIILNLRKTLVLVELPEGATHFGYSCGHDGIYIQWDDGQIDEFEGCIGEHGEDNISDNPRDEFKRIGRFNSTPESYWEGVVHEEENEYSADVIQYRDYNGTSVYDTAKESFISAIEAEGWLLENPYGEKEPIIDDPDPNSQYYGSQMDLVIEWNHWQSKIINLNNVWVFERKEVNND